MNRESYPAPNPQRAARPAPPATLDTRLPSGKLLALTMAGFIAILTENMPAGLLPQIGRALGTTDAMAGQMVTAYALGSGLGAIPVIAATRRWNRRSLLLGAVAVLGVFNLVTAWSGSYGLTLAARFLAGMAGGVVWGLLVGQAQRLVAPGLQGRALAVVGVGQPIALSIGVPLGAWLGDWFDWRGVFCAVSALACALLVWMRLCLPSTAGHAAGASLPIWRIARLPGIRPVLLALFAWILAHNILYTYIVPFLAEANLARQADAVLLLFGTASFLGVWATGLLVDRWLRTLTLLCLAVFAVAALWLGLSVRQPLAVWLGVAAWGFTFGAAPTLLQAALAEAAGAHADVAQSMLVTVFNLAVAGGGVLGGVLLERAGSQALPWAVALLAVLGLGIAWSARAHGFRPGVLAGAH